MGTRFTSDEKWSDSWFMDLNPLQKLVFIYIIENCNLAGFYEVNSRLMSFQIGVSQDEILGAIKGLNRGCLEADGWIWIKNFLRHQKNLNLNPENNAHKHIINLIRCQLDRFDDVPEFKEFLGANQGLFSPIGKGKGKGSGKSKESITTTTDVNIPFATFWDLYNKKEGDKSNCADKWNRLKDSEREKIINTLPVFIAKISDKQYQPYPETYLNQRRWENELPEQPIKTKDATYKDMEIQNWRR